LTASGMSSFPPECRRGGRVSVAEIGPRRKGHGSQVDEDRGAVRPLRLRGLRPRSETRAGRAARRARSQAPVLQVEAANVLAFVNADSRPHQIYSNDCAELSSTVLKPGDTYSVAVGTGPKVCHFQDLLAPLSTGYSGILRVTDEQEERRLATQD